MPRLLLQLLVGALVASPAAAQVAPAEPDQIVIAVRVDARPFAWKDEVTGEYLGFLWDICTEAVQRTGYPFAVKGIDTKERAGFLSGGAGEFDLLCDPTTITLERIRNLAARQEVPHVFSPIFFVANSSYMENSGAAKELPDEVKDLPKAEAWCKGLFRKGATEISANTSTSGTDNAKPVAKEQGGNEAQPIWLVRQLSQLWSEYRFTLRAEPPAAEEQTYVVWGYVEGSTIGEAVKESGMASATTVICLEEVPSHKEAAEKFCTGELTRYYGDIDIARAAVAEYREGGRECNGYDPEIAAPIDYEPYAFALSSRLPDFPRCFTLALYGMFRDGTMDRLFSGHFPGAEKSQHLDTLFRLNSIPPGAQPTRTADSECQ